MNSKFPHSPIEKNQSRLAIKLKSAARRVINRFGYSLVRLRAEELVPYDMDEAFGPIYECTKLYTQTKISNLYALYSAVKYVVGSEVAGDFVECGVWKGGSSMAAALTLLNMGESSRKLWMYDTYSGMTQPSDKDFKSYDGTPAIDQWRMSQRGEANLWNYSPLDEVKSNLRSTDYPEDHLVFVKGRVEDTIPATVPDSIALLRLDTDFYESTLHELLHLFPLLSNGGVLIIDDYGSWTGSREATNQYLALNNISILFHRIDESARIGVKIEPGSHAQSGSKSPAGNTRSPG